MVVLLIVAIVSVTSFFGVDVGLKQATNQPAFQSYHEIDDGLTFESARVVRVVDGDTLVVNVDKEDKKLRLIGVNAPESVHADVSKNTEEGKTASEFTKSIVSTGQTVYLQKDTSDTDRYGRLLRYVWLELPGDASSSEEISSRMLNGVLVYQGYAEAKKYAPDILYAGVFQTLEDDAVIHGRGLSKAWA